MPRRFIDISVPLENGVKSDPDGFVPEITYMNHQQTAGQITGFFPGLKKEDLPDGEGWAVEFVKLITHNGTHLDAPYHFHSTMAASAPSRLTRCRSTGVSGPASNSTSASCRTAMW